MAYREINIKKSKLISKIIENRDQHLVDYKQAVIDYRKEAEEQLNNQLEELKKGNLEIKLNLTKPVNREDRFKKILSTFTWEEQEDIKLSQAEFNEYVLDESLEAQQAITLNSLYRSKFSDK